jgi:hypothetical protein
MNFLNGCVEAYRLGFGPRFDAVLVDEGQDFSLKWWNFLRLGVCRPDGELIQRRKMLAIAAMPLAFGNNAQNAVMTTLKLKLAVRKGPTFPEVLSRSCRRRFLYATLTQVEVQTNVKMIIRIQNPTKLGFPAKVAITWGGGSQGRPDWRGNHRIATWR